MVPAGARAAARAGLRVILADEGFRLGGSLLSERVTVGGVPAAEYAASVVEELKSLSNVTLMPRTTVFGWYDDNVFGAVEKVQKHVAQPSGELPVERVWRIVAKRAILASGAEERPLVFGGNDKPVRRVAWCTGGAQSYFEAAIAMGVDVFITGEISEPQAHLAKETGVAFMACGHHATERYGAPAVAAHVAQALGLQHRFIEIDNPA